MSEPAAKRRLRACRKRFFITLTRKGWRNCRPLDGPFDFEAERGRSRLRVRICFHYPEKGDIVTLGHEPHVYRCYREIWYVGPSGKVELVIRVDGELSDSMKEFK